MVTRGALVLESRVRAEIDVVEHERAKGEHRAADLLALDDVAGALGALDQIVDERVDPARPPIAEQCDFVLRQVGGVEDSEADGVVDVVVDVGDAVDDADDLALERRGLERARVGEDAVADILGEVQGLCNSKRMLVVAEAAAEAVVQGVVERLFARMPERRMADVVPEPDRLDEIFVQAERPRDAARDGAWSRACASSASGSGRRRDR